MPSAMTAVTAMAQRSSRKVSGFPVPALLRIALGRRADGESVTSIAKSLTYKTASGLERTVSRRALYNAFKAYEAERSETP